MNGGTLLQAFTDGLKNLKPKQVKESNRKAAL
jgi:hypothetical protein